MKKSLVSIVALAVALSSVASATTAFAAPSANESISQIAQNAQAKQALIQTLQDRIARHERMSLEEIAAELESGIAARRKEAVESGKVDATQFDALAAQGLAQIHALGGKDAIIAMEAAQLQQVMSSENLLFFFTRSIFFPNSFGHGHVDTRNPCQVHRVDECVAWSFSLPFQGLAFVLFGAIDIVTLPFTLIASAASGF